MVSINNEHDKTYKAFLEHKRTFLEFLQDFVHEEWVQDLQEDNLTLVDKSFILKDYQEKEADIIYEVKINGTKVYFYLLLELQSTVDYTMPYRLLLYMTELWRQYFDNTDERTKRNKSFKLPAIIPMLLYNGKKKWTVAQSFARYQNGYEKFDKHILDFEYILFNVNGYNEKELYEIGSLMSAIFLLDQNIDKEEFISRFKRLVILIQRLSPEQWNRLKRWILKILLPGIPESNRNKIAELIEESDIMEVDKMVMNLEVNFKKWMHDARQEGKQEGRQEGRQEGLFEAAKLALQKGKSIDEVAELLELPYNIVEKLQKEINPVN